MLSKTRFQFRYSLRIELVIVMVLLATLPAVLGRYIGYWNLRETLTEQQQVAAQVHLAHRAHNLEDVLEQHSERLQVLSNTLYLPYQAAQLEALEDELAEKLRSVFANFVASHFEVLHSLAWVNEEGLVLISSEQSEQQQRIDLGPELSSSSESPFTVQTFSERQSVSLEMFYRVYSPASGALLGYLRLQFKHKFWTSILSHLETPGVGYYSFVLNRKGELVGHLEVDGFETDLSILEDTAGLCAQASALPERFIAREAPNQLGESLLQVVLWAPEHGLCFGKELSIQDNLNALHEGSQQLLLSLVILIVSTLATALLLSRRLTEPINSLVSLTRKLADGSFEGTATAPSRFAEVQTLYRSFNDMANSLETYNRFLEERVEQRTVELLEKNDQLEQTMEELDAERKKQLQQAYNAGMAENAVSVLHNIGNAITPMVIRLQNYRNQHQKNQIAEYLQMLQNLLITQLEQGNLERFLKEDPRGRQIPQFMEQLTQQQKQGNEVLSEMLNNLDHQFRHITEIIALQQKYAHMQGVEETYPLASVVEDSLGMMQPSLEKRNVVGKLVESSGTALVHNDPNKMAQLFLNLFKNSVEALDARLSKEPKFRGTIEIRIREEEGVVYVEVQDNGQGVAPETLPHAFEFGFSTKNRGSGFGLHDCANFIRAQGGEIRLESEGLGQGAKVSLSLPSASAGGKVSNSVTTLDPA